MDNNDAFLEIFGKIEKYLCDFTETIHFYRFSDLLEKSYKKNPILGKYNNQLRRFSEIRNALEHQDGKKALTVSDLTIQKIKKIYEGITSPPTVYEKFAKEVYVCQASDSLSTVLKTMKEKVYTHVPVYDNETYIGVLSEPSIANWLADKKSIVLESIKISELKEFLNNQPNERFEFVSTNKNAYEVRKWFEEDIKEHKRLGAVFITQSGTPHEKLIGIITAWDLPGLDPIETKETG